MTSAIQWHIARIQNVRQSQSSRKCWFIASAHHFSDGLMVRVSAYCEVCVCAVQQVKHDIDVDNHVVQLIITTSCKKQTNEPKRWSSERYVCMPLRTLTLI